MTAEIINDMIDPIIIHDLEGKITQINDAFTETLGWSEEAIGKLITEFVIERDIPRVERYIKEAFEKGYIKNFECVAITKDKKEIPILVSTTLMRDLKGNPKGLISVARNLTESKRMQVEVDKAREYAESIVDTVREPLIVLDPNLRVVSANRSFYQTFQVTPEETENQLIYELGDRQWNIPKLRRLLEEILPKNATLENYEVEHEFPSIGRRVMLLNARRIYRKASKTQLILLAIEDITERKKMEDEILNQNKFLNNILESLTYPFYVIDAKDYTVTMANSAAGFHISPEESTCYEFTHKRKKPCSGAEHPCTLEKVKKTKKPAITEHIHHDKDGNLRNYEFHGYPIFDDAGNVVHIIEYFFDVTKRKRMEKRLKKTVAALKKSNAELEQFAYIASHDLQEPLRMVASYVQLLSQRYKGRLDKDADEFIAYAVDGVNHMQRLLNDLLKYSRVGTRGKPFEPTDCEFALERALTNLQMVIEESDAIVTNDPLPMVMADGSQLVQLFQNLIDNAIKFRNEEPPRIHVSARKEGSSWVFSVSDNGIGIASEYFERIFVIFQRLHSREEYPGTGIGLAICKKIVERHGGRIWVESQPGRGSTFYFTIPTHRSR